MIKNLILTLLLSGFTASNTIYFESDLLVLDGKQDVINFNIDFIEYYNTYSNYGENRYQLQSESVYVGYDTGINENEFYPDTYQIFNDTVVWSDSAQEIYLTFYKNGDVILDYQGYWSNFDYLYMDISTDLLQFTDYILKSYIYGVINKVSYNLNSNINYNAPYNKTRSPYIAIDNNAGMPRWDKTLNLGYFISNGAIYTEMIMTYKRIDNAYPTYFTNNQSTGLVGGEDTIFKGADGLYYASELVYYNRYTQASSRVWLRNDTYLGDKYVIANGGTWVNSNYRSFTVLGDFIGFTDLDKADTLEILGLLNDGQFIEVVPPSNDITNVFDLLTSAFNSLGGLLSIAVFPGITLGLLLCIPIFALVLFFIIGLFKR